MAKNTRLPADRDAARQEIARKYLMGIPQNEIAAEMGVTQQQISYDLSVIRREWREAAIADINELIDRELARVGLLESEAWGGWERSCANGPGDPRFIAIV